MCFAGSFIPHVFDVLTVSKDLCLGARSTASTRQGRLHHPVTSLLAGVGDLCKTLTQKCVFCTCRFSLQRNLGLVKKFV